MAQIIVDVMDLIDPLRPSPPADDEGDDVLIEFSGHETPAEISAGFRKLWGMVLCMAVRDRATAVQYHPWRSGPLAYVVDGVRHEMVPPPAEFAPWIVNEARAVFTTRPGFFARLLGRNRVSCGTVRFVVGAPTLWDAVVWSTGGRSGVDLFRITPLDQFELV